MRARSIFTPHGLSLICRIILGALFLYASLDKIANPELFVRAVSNYRLLPANLVNLFSILLPWVEAICGLLLITGPFTRSAALIVAAMLGVFVVAIVLALARDLDIECGCFDTTEGRRIGLKLLAEDLVLLAMCVWSFLFDSGKWSLDRFVRSRTLVRSPG